MTEHEKLVEKVARAIFEHWQFQANSPLHRPIPWVEGGNSEKQHEARDYARAALSVIREAGLMPDLDAMSYEQIMAVHDHCHVVIEERAGKAISAGRARKARAYRAMIAASALNEGET